MGANPLICGTPFYSGRNLTADIASRDQYFEILNGQSARPAVDSDNLRKFLHLVIYRLVKRPEFFDGMHGHPQKPRIRIETFEGFPGSMPIFDGIVDSILNRRSFVDLTNFADMPSQAVPA